LDSTASPGRVIGRRYRLVRQLGSRGHGRVWTAHDEVLNRDVAVKEVRLPPASEGQHRERLARAIRETRYAATLHNPHIVTVYDMVVEDNVLWPVMQLVDGRSLEEHLRADGPLPAERAAEVAAALLDALKAAHAAGFVHRDVKPANVLLAAGGRVLLTGFGIAAHQTDTASRASLTMTGWVIGTPAYMAPERLTGSGSGSGSGASDLFSVGVTLYEAVEGISPFRRDDVTATLAAVVLDEAPPPQRAGALAPLITALLAKDPHDRPTIDGAVAMLHRGPAARPLMETRAPAPAPAAPMSIAAPSTLGPALPSIRGLRALPRSALVTFGWGLALIGLVLALPNARGWWWPALLVAAWGVATWRAVSLARRRTALAAPAMASAPGGPRLGQAFLTGLTEVAGFTRPRDAVRSPRVGREELLRDAYARLGPPPVIAPRRPDPGDRGDSPGVAE
jgi:protein kinase-like protein